jgi:hypothetical protein
MRVYIPAVNFNGRQVRTMFVVIAPTVCAPHSLRSSLDNLDKASRRGASAFENSLNAQNLSETIYKLEEERAARFFDPQNLELVGKRARKFDFVSQLTAMTQNPGAYDAKQKLKMLQFVSDAYNDHIGAPRTTVKLYKGDASTDGYFKPGGSTIYINENSPNFTQDFAKAVNTVVHENTHNGQDNPNVYSHPVLSRIYRANFNAYRGAQIHGYKAYRSQPVEVGAHAAGEAAEKHLRMLVGVNDNRPAIARRSAYTMGLAA